MRTGEICKTKEAPAVPGGFAFDSRRNLCLLSEAEGVGSARWAGFNAARVFPQTRLEPRFVPRIKLIDNQAAAVVLLNF